MGGMKDIVLADKLSAELARLRATAEDAGIPEEHIVALLDKHRELFDESRPLPVVCGNVDKETRYPCTRAPHEDEPFKRGTHAFKLPDGTQITWRSALNLPEQLAVEAVDIKGGRKQVCGVKCHHGQPNLRCVRAKHGPDVEHAGYVGEELTTWLDKSTEPAPA